MHPTISYGYEYVFEIFMVCAFGYVKFVPCECEADLELKLKKNRWVGSVGWLQGPI